MQTDTLWQAIVPFGPIIVKGKMSDALVADMKDIFKHRSENEISEEDNNQKNLAGNINKEFLIKPEDFKDAQEFQKCMEFGATYLYGSNTERLWLSQQEPLCQPHAEMIQEKINNGFNLAMEIMAVWGNISVAGDFNPLHHHSGSISGVGYLGNPPGIEREWLLEDHEPSVGMISFWDGRPQSWANHMHKVRPVEGDIYFFPAWLPHSVQPFRSEGERWSFSFNLEIQNQAGHPLELTDFEKKMLKKEQARMVKDLDAS